MFMLFLNGLPLGMVFGLVLTFLEGRKLTEALVAGLCISFIVSSGVVKSIGESLILSGVSEFWMPFSAGLIFIVPLLISVWMLSHIPVPTQADVDLRTERVAMDHLARRSFFRRHIFAIVSLLFIYFVLTIIRSIRDDFGVEIWQQLGYGGKPENYTLSELQVGFWVTVICAGSFLIKRNRAAFLWSLVSIIIGFGLMLITVIAYHQHWITGFQFMVLLGLGIYIPYVSFHTTVFERFLAALHEKGTIGYLMYLADAFGYLAYVAIVMINLRLHAGGDEIETAQASTPKLFLELLEGVSFGFAILVIAFTLILMIYFSRKIPKQHTTVTLKQRENG